MPRNQLPFGGAGEVAAPLRRDERSGLLDIRTLSSIVESQQRARASHASASSVALPAFTNSWALQDVSAPAPAAKQPTPRKVAAPDQRPLYMMILALSAAVVSLGALIAFRPSPTVVVERTMTPVSAAAATQAPDDRTAEAEAEPSKKPVAVVAPVDEDPKEGADEPAKADAETKAKHPRGARRPGRTVPKTDAEPKPTKAKSDGTIPVECVIDPSQCSRSGKKKKPDTGDDDTASTKGLPPAPSSTQIRNAMNQVKPQAKACGPKNGGHSGEKVRVKLSVAGATGKVTSATALDDHAGTALGRCVAGALGQAMLPRFSKPQAGVVYAITL